MVNEKMRYAYECKDYKCGFQWFSNNVVGLECPKCKNKDVRSGHVRPVGRTGPLSIV